MVRSLEENQTTALLLNSNALLQGETLDQDITVVDFNRSIGFSSQVQQLFTEPGSLSEAQEVNLSAMRFDKQYLRREIGTKQLNSGYMRLDLADPLQQGNFIVLKGDNQASGKHMVVQGIIKNFLSESKDHRVVVAGLNRQHAQKVLSGIERKDQVCVLASGPSGNGLAGGLAEQYLTPLAALKFIQQHIESSEEKPKILFVAGDLMLHSFREKEIYDLAN